QSMATLTPRFSANRTVREYTERYYLPLAARYRERAANQGAAGGALLWWRRALAGHWAGGRFRWTHIRRRAGSDPYQLTDQLGGVAANAVLVELYADGQDEQTAQRLPMTRAGRVEGSANGYVFTALVPASRPLSDWTPRVIPDHPGAAVPLEAAQILWSR